MKRWIVGAKERSEINWEARAAAVDANARNWATPDPWAARRAAVRSIDNYLSRRFIDGRIARPTAWDYSDFLDLQRDKAS